MTIDDKEHAANIIKVNNGYIKRVLLGNHLHNSVVKLEENEQLFYRLFYNNEEKQKKGIKKCQISK